MINEKKDVTYRAQHIRINRLGFPEKRVALTTQNPPLADKAPQDQCGLRLGEIDTLRTVSMSPGRPPTCLQKNRIFRTGRDRNGLTWPIGLMYRCRCVCFTPREPEMVSRLGGMSTCVSPTRLCARRDHMHRCTFSIFYRNAIDRFTL